jgi:ppGpp synthetase/RelA/SpoT-type nucleotidyltranferase
MREVHLKRFQQEYRDLAPLAARFGEVLAAELTQLLRRNGVELAVPAEHRVKAWASVEDKLRRMQERKPGFSGATLQELNDLVGARVILLFRRDLPTACALLEESFRVDSRSDKGESLSDQQFGYQSIHFDVRPLDAWLKVPSFAGFHDLRAEIQVRTLAQHLWAAASHKLQYKHEQGVPHPVRRSVHRVSALLETVDLELERVLADRDEYRRTIPEDDSNRELNTDLLEAILSEQLPRGNRRAFENYSLLLWELVHVGIATTSDLRSLIQNRLAQAVAKDAEIVAKSESEDLRQPGMFFSHAGLVRMMLEAEFGDGYYSRIWSSAEQRRRADD